MPPPSRTSSDHVATVRRINATLQGPVMDALADLVPELKGLPRRHALDAVLDDPDLLHRCFLAFRASPEGFRHLLVNKHHMEVDEADAILECGRSLDDVVGMVVRTCAKRHFRRHLDGTNGRTPMRTKPPARQDLLTRLARLFAEPPKPTKPKRTKAEILYAAFQEHLRHDWQVPLVTEYSKFTPSQVRAIGPRLLDYKLAEDVRRLREAPDEAFEPTPVPDDMVGPFNLKPKPQKKAEVTGSVNLPGALFKDLRPGQPPAAPGPAKERPVGGGAVYGAPLDDDEPPARAGSAAAVSGGAVYGAPLEDGPKMIYEPPKRGKDERARIDDVLSADGTRLKAAAFTAVLVDPQVRACLANGEETVRLNAILSGVGGLTIKMLVGELGLRKDQLAVLLISAHAALGEKAFAKAFGLPGTPDYVYKFMERAKAAGIGQDLPVSQVAAFVNRTFQKSALPAQNRPAQAPAQPPRAVVT